MLFRSPTIIQNSDGEFCVRDENGFSCGCDNFNKGVVGQGALTFLTKATLIQGIGRNGTTAAKNYFIDTIDMDSQKAVVLWVSDQVYLWGSDCRFVVNQKTFTRC